MAFNTNIVEVFESTIKRYNFSYCEIPSIPIEYEVSDPNVHFGQVVTYLMNNSALYNYYDFALANKNTEYSTTRKASIININHLVNMFKREFENEFYEFYYNTFITDYLAGKVLCEPDGTCLNENAKTYFKVWEMKYENRPVFAAIYKLQEYIPMLFEHALEKNDISTEMFKLIPQDYEFKDNSVCLKFLVVS